MDELWDGSKELADGLGEIAEHNQDLKDAVDTLFDTLLEEANDSFAENEIEVVLKADTFEEQLDAMIASVGTYSKGTRDSVRDLKETLQNLRKFKEGITEYTDAVQEAADGSRELADGVKELKDATDDMIEEYFTFDLDNLTSFLKKSDNPRIYGSYNDVVINKYAGIAAGIILMVLFTYVIAVFVIHNIEQESSIIGALYALGLKSRQLILHYLLLPVLVTFLGGAAGCIIGMTPAGMDWMLDSAVDYYSFPRPVTVLPPYVLVYALIMPPVTAAIVNYFCISKKLRRTALSLLRNEQRVSRIREVKLGNHFSFATRFQIRQMLRESHSALAVIIGMYICLLIVVLSLDCYVMCENYRLAAVNETTYEYMYNYKYPTKEVPEGGTPAYAEGLKKEAYGYNLEVTILGITEDNPYFDVEVGKYKNEIVIASAVAEKFQVKKGDKMVFTDEVNHRDYAFTVKDVVYMESAFYCFMDLDAMRELFGQEDDYYNVVFAGHSLDVDAGRLYSTVTRENVMEACSIFVDMMKPMVSLLLGLSALIFVVVMYLMVKVMVDRSAFSIALVKIFGFRRREIRKLYLNGNFLLVAIGALICIPLAKLSVDAIYPLCISNVAVGMDLHFTWQMYVGVYMGVLLCYLIITPLLMRRIHKRVPAEILKNRE